MESTDDGLITFDNKMWFKRISNEEAFRIRLDVQMYVHHVQDGIKYLDDDATPEWYRERHLEYSDANNPDSWVWTHYIRYIQVDPPDKEEYKPVE